MPQRAQQQFTRAGGEQQQGEPQAIPAVAWLPQQYTERVEAPGGAREHTCGLGHRHQADAHPQRLERPEKQLGSAYGTHRCEPGDGGQTIRATGNRGRHSRSRPRIGRRGHDGYGAIPRRPQPEGTNLICQLPKTAATRAYPPQARTKANGVPTVPASNIVGIRAAVQIASLTKARWPWPAAKKA